MEQKLVGGAFLMRRSWWSGRSVYSEWKVRGSSQNMLYSQEAVWWTKNFKPGYVPEECLKYSAFHSSGGGTLINFLWVFLDFLSKNFLEIHW